MKRTLTTFVAIALAAGALSACQKKVEESSTTTTATTTSTAPTEATATPVNAPSDGYVSGNAVTVPEMKPTGDMTSAVDPKKPSAPAPGAAPQMAPTGNEREPYKPGPTGK